MQETDRRPHAGNSLDTILTSDATDAINGIVDEVKAKGWAHRSGLVNPDVLALLDKDTNAFRDRHYTTDNLVKHVAYLSDKSPTRESYAFMISANGEPPLPGITDLPGSIFLLEKMHLAIVQGVAGTRLGCRYARRPRSMLNFQTYWDRSKPVVEHFDGEYLAYEEEYEGRDKKYAGFRLLEGLCPRVVFIVTLKNHSESKQGTVLRRLKDDETFSPPSAPGDVLVFDNITVRHSVPEIVGTAPEGEPVRKMVGLRTFDYEPFYYHHALGFEEMPTRLSVMRQMAFMESEWPRQLEQQRRNGAVF